jgi:TRAP transporter 4TM/12TM fusion protein
MSNKKGQDSASFSKKRSLSNFFKKSVFIISLTFALLNISVLLYFPINAWIHLAACLCFAVVLIFIIYKGPYEKERPTAIHILLDFALIIATISSTFYYASEHNEMIFRVSAFPTFWDVFFSVVLVVIVLEATRRASSGALAIVCSAFLTYAFVGHLLPPSLGHSGFSFNRIVTYMAGDNGIWGVGLGAATSYVFLFIIFGEFLNKFGGGEVFINLAMGLAGHYRGGPAKVAVLSSALFGTISGSSIANVAATGSFTIPLMKKIGYRSEFAGAVEAAASTGGQIMPPVMGSSAFIMAEIVGISYAVLATKAFLPACFYFFAILVMVHCEAIRSGLVGLPKDTLPSVKLLMKEKWAYLLPIVVVFVSLLVLKVSTSRAALYGILACLIVPLISLRGSFKSSKVFEALAGGGVAIVSIIAACSAAGLVVGVLALTGLGMKIATVLIELSGGYLFPLLVSTMFLSILLGMGLSTLPAYIISASVSAPILTMAGLPMLSAHLFVYYYAIFAVVTPPVALASYTAAGIANANITKVGFEGFKLASAGIIVPFLFVYSPALLLEGPVNVVVQAIFTAFLGIVFFACALQGYLLIRLKPAQRIILFFSSLLMIKSGLLTDLLGIIGAIVAIMLYQESREMLFQILAKVFRFTCIKKNGGK